MFVTLSFSTAAKKTAQSGYGSTKVISSFSWGTQNWCSTRGGVGVVAAPGVSLRCWSTGTTELQTPNKEGAWGWSEVWTNTGNQYNVTFIKSATSVQRIHASCSAPYILSSFCYVKLFNDSWSLFNTVPVTEIKKKKTASLQWSSNLLVAAHWPLWKQTSSAQSCVKMSASQRQRIFWTKP